jgi:hypothetical protein
MNHPRWREGRLSTGFIAEEYPQGLFSAEQPEGGSLEPCLRVGALRPRCAARTEAAGPFPARCRAASGRDEVRLRCADRATICRSDGRATRLTHRMPLELDIAVGLPGRAAHL